MQPMKSTRAHYLTKRQGGDGAVREVIEIILKARVPGTAIAKYGPVLAALLTLGSRGLFADSVAEPPSAR